jgi:hypothetical protein
MVFSTTWLEFKDMAQDPLVRREPVSVSCNRWPDEGLETQKYSLYPKEHPDNCLLRWRLSNCLGCISHDCKLDLVTIQGNLTGDQRRLATSCCPPFRQPPTIYKACVYGWQRQASSFKSSNRLPPKRSRDFCSLASHEPRFESHRAYLGHARPSYACSGTSCAKHSSVGSSIAGLRPSSKHVGVTPGTDLWTIEVVKWFISDVLKVKWQSYRAFWTVKVNT